MNLGKLSVALMGAFLLSMSLRAVSQQSDDKAAAEKPAAEKKSETKGDAAKGKTVFVDRCEICHSADSEEVKVGPGLKGLFKKQDHKLEDGKEHPHTVATIREQIENGSTSMPPMKEMLSAEEIEHVLAYLQTL